MCGCGTFGMTDGKICGLELADPTTTFITCLDEESSKILSPLALDPNWN